MASNPLPTETELLAMLDRFRNEALRAEVPVLQELTDAFSRLYTRLELRLDVALNKIWNNGGEIISRAFVERQLADLAAEIEAELNKYQAYLETVIESEIEKALILGGQQSGQLLKAMTGGANITLLNFKQADVLNTMIGLLSWRGTLFEQVQKLSKYYAPLVKDIMVEAVALGYGPRKAAGMIEPFLKEIKDKFQVTMARPYADAVRMTRTAQLWAAREATRQNYLVSNVVTGWVWHARLDAVVCMACVAMHGSEHTKDEILNDHWNGRCLVPGTRVSSASITAFVSRRYDGDVVNIRTASGKFLTVTPNHPILTDYGWTPANLITKGCNVVSYLRDEGASLGMDPNKHHVPTLIEDVPRALGMDCFIPVPCSPEDFHGDGADSNIYVIRTNRFLWDGLQSSLQEPLIQDGLGGRNTEFDTLSGIGDFGSMLEGVLHSSTDELCFFDPFSFHTCGNFGHHEPVGVSLFSQWYAGVNQANFNYVTPGLEGLSESIDRFPAHIPHDKFFFGDGERVVQHRSIGNFIGDNPILLRAAPQHPATLDFILESLRSDVIASGQSLNSDALGDIILDSVLDVSVSRFSGHVYNLQTKEGWYNSNGIITHNCAMVPMILGNHPFPDKPTGEEWFNSLSPAQQKKMMGPGKYEAWQSGKFAFADLAVQKEDTTYGQMTMEATLKSLLER